MKNLLILLFLTISLSTFSQKYPRIEIDSSGNKIVVMTIEQAQKIDNNLEVLSLLEKSIVDCENLNTSYIKVIDEQKRTIALLETDNKLLKEQLTDSQSKINNLQQRLDNAISISDHCETQKSELDGKVKTLEAKVTELKIKKNIGWGVGVLGAIGGVLLVIFVK